MRSVPDRIAGRASGILFYDLALWSDRLVYRPKAEPPVACRAFVSEARGFGMRNPPVQFRGKAGQYSMYGLDRKSVV